MPVHHHDPEAVQAATLNAAKLAGCDCHCHITLTETVAGMFYADIFHGSACSLLKSQVAKWN